MNEDTEAGKTGLEIAVIGMAGRFPGAKHIHEFWNNLKHGVESISFFTDEELKAADVDPRLLENPNYVKADGILKDIEYFDAAFFGYTPKEAEIMDPQIRIFHECAWEVLEDAGYYAGAYDGLIGLYAGATHNLDWEARALLSGKSGEIGDFAAAQLMRKDFLSLRISYKFNLMGPGFVLYTACSTSLVAIHLACQGILNGECDMALSGGVTVLSLDKGGYMYQDGMIGSADGHCRAFDAQASGIISGNGAGIVLLKRLEDALLDRDHIYAVIKGSAINNDGIRKAGFTAPSVEGQAEVIKMALQVAEVEAESIGYVETHGTATELGDPVEFEGLKLAFNTNKKGICGIGSVKTNVGHLDAAAGVTSLIKMALALNHHLIPPSINFESPNPKIDFIDSPFYVNSALTEWETDGYPRRAGVSSFGIGGTNAHVVLEEAPVTGPSVSAGETTGKERYHLILLSARTEVTLQTMIRNLADYFKNNREMNLADAAYTLKIGRKAFNRRWMAVCSSIDEAIEALTDPEGGEIHKISPEEENPVADKVEFSSHRDSLKEIGRLWLQGKKIDWEAFYSREKRYRIPLPTYPFERQRYWIEGSEVKTGAERSNENSPSGTERDMGNWFYLPTWKRSLPNPNGQSSGEPGVDRHYRWLVLGNGHNWENLLVKRLLEKGEDVITVKKGAAFSRVDDPGKGADVFTLNPGESGGYKDLFNRLSAAGGLPDKIIHCWNVTGQRDNPLNGASFDEAQWLGFYSMLYIARAVGEQDTGHDIQLILLTDHLQEVIGGEDLCPEKAPALGLMKAIPQEYPGISCKSIDILLPEPGTLQETGLVHALLEEFTLSGDGSDPVTAFRNNQRWVEVFDPFPLLSREESADFTQTPGMLLELREKGVYFITGGLGKIGLMFSQLLANRVGARLVLTGRSAFPAREEWNRWLETHDDSDPTAFKIKRLQHIEEMGGKVLYLQADAADAEQMNKAVAQAENTFGKINGVIHSAGIIEGRSMRSIRELSEDDCRLQFQAKAHGLMVLREVFKNREPDFYWLLSSISCVLAGLGLGAYASANLFMDVFTRRENQRDSSGSYHPRWFSLNWDGMDDRESIAAFERIFSLRKTNIHQLVFSRGGNLHARIDRWIKMETVRGRDVSTSPVEENSSLYPRPDLSTPYEAPRSPVEKAVANIWKGILGYDEIGIQDDFLELGGDSLKSITVISRIHQELHVNVPLTVFFSKPTPGGIAQYISTHDKKDMDMDVSMQPLEEKEYYPAFPPQKRLYIVHQMQKDEVTYNMSYALMLEYAIDIHRLEETFKKLIERHESLRTSFELHEAMVIQRIHRSVGFAVEIIDMADTEKEKGIDEMVKGFIQPFDLSADSLFRAGLIKIEEKKHILVVDMHHIISDGISLQIAVKDFMSLYKGEELSPLMLRYKDFSEWHHIKKNGSLIKKQEEYWIEEFQGDIPELLLPYDYPRPAVQNFAGNSIDFALEEIETKGLNEIAGKKDATLFMIIVAVYNVLLAKLSGQEDIIVGTGVGGRRHKELEEMIGLFVNTLPLRNYPKSGLTFNAFLQEVKEKTLLAFENQDYPLEELVEKLVPHRNPGGNPLFDAVIVFQNMLMEPEPAQESETSESAPANFQPFGYENTISKFDISLLCTPTKDRLYFTIEYATKLFKKETVETFITYFKEIVTAILGNSNIRLEDIAISHRLLRAKSTKPVMELKFNKIWGD